MNDPVERAREKIKRVEGFEKVKFIILYGSTAEGWVTGMDLFCAY